MKLKCDAPLSNFAFKFNLRRYNKEFTLRVNAAIDSGHQPNLAGIAREVRHPCT